MMTGSRLAYVVVELEGTVMRKQFTLVGKEIGKGKNVRLIHSREEHWVEEPAGYMVYFPRGHAIRIRDKAELRHYKLDGSPPIVDLNGLQDPNSPVGKLLAAQDDKGRAEAMKSMEEKVIQLVTRRVGTELLTRNEKAA